MQWQIDSSHSSVTAAVKHMMLTTVRGAFSGASGVIDFDPAMPESGAVELRIPAASVNTGDEKRDGHLRSADFLDAASHPDIIFKSTKITPQGSSKSEFVVDGDLTIRGTTKPVAVNVELVGIAADPRAGQRAGFDAKFSFDRTQWGLVWNMPIPSGVLVGEKITIEANIAATPVAKTQPVAA
ncbi:MAG TPA: YceI family protein [Candidatus Limnocylindria bacterium]|nr:YceI family protein [Candidatus Limnocylindria bacterium]